MKRQITIFLTLAMLVGLLAAAFPSPVSAAPSIISVSPNLVVNNVTNEVTVNGSGFESGSLVTVGGTAVTTTVDTVNTLRIVIPSGFGSGIYDVTVTNPSDSSYYTLPAGLTVEAPTPTPQPTGRPVIVIDTYSTSVSSVTYGQDFNLNVSLDNAGGSTAYGIQVTFTSADLIMLKNGGVSAGGDLGTAGKSPISQTMTAAASLVGQSRVSVEMTVTYSDDKGTSYSDKFTLYFNVTGGGGSGGSYISATATPTGVRRPQLVVMSYSTDVDPLQPGYQFVLSLDVQNVGTVAAKGVTLILGGGSASGSGTPGGGISGGSGEFTNFAPVGSSNIQSLGDVQPGASVVATQKLVVNVSTNPGAYPVKIAFSYLDQNGNPVLDEQVITLLVYALPSVNVSFYQPVGEVYAGQPAMLPLQVVSMSKRTAVLGTMTVTSTGGYLENGESFIGSLDPGGYFMLDAMITPDAAGPLDLVITIDYVDDFNQSRTLTQTLTLDVLDMPFEPTLDPSYPTDDSGVIVDPSAGGETFWQKAWRFILGLLGLDSGIPAGNMPTDIIPAEPEIIEVVPGKG